MRSISIRPKGSSQAMQHSKSFRGHGRMHRSAPSPTIILVVAQLHPENHFEHQAGVSQPTIRRWPDDFTTPNATFILTLTTFGGGEWLIPLKQMRNGMCHSASSCASFTSPASSFRSCKPQSFSGRCLNE